MSTQWSFRTIADDIAAQIRDGRLAPGQRLPGRTELAPRYGVSPATIARSLILLEAWGLTRGRQGMAVFVRPVSGE